MFHSDLQWNLSGHKDNRNHILNRFVWEIFLRSEKGLLEFLSYKIFENYKRGDKWYNVITVQIGQRPLVRTE